ELHGRDVDGELEMPGPAPCLLERLFHHAQRQRTDQAGAFGGFDETVRLQQHTARRAPACERLEADDLAAVEVDERLEEGHELAGFDTAANFLFQPEPVADLAL